MPASVKATTILGGAVGSLDERLSQAQLVLRDGYHDDLSRAVADARNALVDLQPLLATVMEQYEQKAKQYRESGGSTRTGRWLRGELTCYVPRALMHALRRKGRR